MTDNDERIGTLIPRGYQSYLAKCGVCSWTWQGDRKTAEEHLRGHANLSHPPAIPIYRKARNA